MRHGPLAKQLNECARDGNVAGALALFDGSDATLSTRSYNSLLTLLVDGHRDDFRRVRDHMRAAGVAADESTLSLELRGLVADGALDDAFASLRAAAAEGVALKLRSYTALHRALCERRELARVDDLHAHMRAHGVEPAEAELVAPPRSAPPSARATAPSAAHSRRRAQRRPARSARSPRVGRRRRRGRGRLGCSRLGRRRLEAARLAAVGADGTCSACGARLEAVTAAQRRTLAAAARGRRRARSARRAGAGWGVGRGRGGAVCVHGRRRQRRLPLAEL